MPLPVHDQTVLIVVVIDQSSLVLRIGVITE